MPTLAGTYRYIYVPTHSNTWDTNLMDIFIWMMGGTGMCKHLERWRHMRSFQQLLTHLVADMCWHLGYQSYGSFYLDTEKCWHVSISGKVPTHADTCKCRHVPAPVILIIWTLFGYWDVLTCTSTWKSADTWEGADTTCWHVPTQLYGFWDVLTFCSTWESADTWRVLSAQVS